MEHFKLDEKLERINYIVLIDITSSDKLQVNTSAFQ